MNKLPLVHHKASIKEAMRIIDQGELGIAFVINDKEALVGAVTDGDIRRALLQGTDIAKPVGDISNKNPISIEAGFTDKELRVFKSRKDIVEKIPFMGALKVPVVDSKNRVQDLIIVASEHKKTAKETAARRPVKRVLVTGGAGYLGSVLCRQLLKQGYRVRVLDNVSYGSHGIDSVLKEARFEFSKGDIRNVSDVIHALQGVDAVIHLAAIVGDPASAKDPKETLEINYLATKNVVEACKYLQINRFIFASTCSVYGQSLNADQVLTEESPLNPVSLYAQTKIQCERAILESFDENFAPTILRMATLYGYSPNMRFDLAVNILTARAAFEKKLPIFGGDQWRPWLHLDDAAQAYIKCLQSPLEKVKGEIFNVASENYKIIDVGKKIKQVLPAAKIEISKTVSDVRDYNVSFAKISKVLRFLPKRVIADGVEEIHGVIKKGVITTYKDQKYRIYSA